MARKQFGLFSAVLGAGLLLAPGIQAQTTERVSVNSDGIQTDAISPSLFPSISADGSDVAFQSYSTNLVAGDTNNMGDIFVHDRSTGITTRVSVSSDGVQANDYSSIPGISADGRYVVFRSSATNLVADDTNNISDIFVHDRETGITTRVNVNSDGVQANGQSFGFAISADGRLIAFQSVASNHVADDTTPYMADIFVHDRETGITTLVSVNSDGVQANSYSFFPAISADGNTVSFSSMASNLVADDTNDVSDIFVHDRMAGVTTRVSANSNRVEKFSTVNQSVSHLSADGRFIAFSSWASDLVAGDTNRAWDIFVHDRETGITTRVNVNSDGVQAKGESRLSYGAAISADGRLIGFTSIAGNLVADDTNQVWDAFVHDRDTGITTRVSVSSDGVQANMGSYAPAISADGGLIAFSSGASNLVADDTNDTWDVFVHDLAPDVPGANTAPPMVGAITAPADPVQVNTNVAVSADFTDPDTGDSHTGVWNWGDGTTSAGTVAETNGSGTITGEHIYTTPGIYTVTVTVSDGAGQGSSVFKYVVVFDPRGNFVVGGGIITSPLGAYSPDSSMTGRANFGFVAKYERKATTPTGNTEFQFQAAGLNFHSQNYEWLVVAGARAQFKGTGTINGAGSYGFMLTAIDGDVSGGGGIDKFRIKIWSTIGGGMVYDNELGQVADDGAPTTALDGGSIMIKTKVEKTSGGGAKTDDGGGSGKGGGKKK